MYSSTGYIYMVVCVVSQVFWLLVCHVTPFGNSNNIFNIFWRISQRGTQKEGHPAKIDFSPLTSPLSTFSSAVLTYKNILRIYYGVYFAFCREKGSAGRPFPTILDIRDFCLLKKIIVFIHFVCMCRTLLDDVVRGWRCPRRLRVHPSTYC